MLRENLMFIVVSENFPNHNIQLSICFNSFEVINLCDKNTSYIFETFMVKSKSRSEKMAYKTV